MAPPQRDNFKSYSATSNEFRRQRRIRTRIKNFFLKSRTPPLDRMAQTFAAAAGGGGPWENLFDGRRISLEELLGRPGEG